MPTDLYPLRVLLLTLSGFLSPCGDPLRPGLAAPACNEFVEHYHTERAHQGLGNERVESVVATGTGDLKCVERLGGILKHYRRAA